LKRNYLMNKKKEENSILKNFDNNLYIYKLKKEYSRRKIKSFHIIKENKSSFDLTQSYKDKYNNNNFIKSSFDKDKVVNRSYDINMDMKYKISNRKNFNNKKLRLKFYSPLNNINNNNNNINSYYSKLINYILY
jgi:hypothetical protein